MSELRMDVQGVEEAAEALEKLKTNVPPEVEVALNAGIQPIALAMKSYPPKPPYMGMRNYGSAVVTYKRTNNYQQRITTLVRRVGGEIIGYINSAADYSTYLRGNLDGYEGTWFHRPFWKSLRKIVDELLPQAQQRIEQQIDRLTRRLGLGA
jgi:hypothetical protein